jgi:hypothetical protein
MCWVYVSAEDDRRDLGNTGAKFVGNKGSGLRGVV